MKLNLSQAVVILAAALSVLVGAQAAVAAVDASALPSELVPFWQGVVYVFSAGVGVVVFTFLRNILGYVENKFEAATPEDKAKIQYEASQLGATATKFSLYIYGFTAGIQTIFVGTPYAQYAVYVAGGIGIMFDLVLKSIENIAIRTKPKVAK